jgi:hypothetical protein
MFFFCVVEPEPQLLPLRGTGTGFGSGSNIKWNTKVNKVFKNQNERPTF